MNLPVRSPSSRRLVLLAATLALAACQPRTATDVHVESIAESTAPASPPATQGAHAITGTAAYRERIKMPPGGSLRVQLLDNLLADTPNAMIADKTFKDVAGPPYAFSLPFDPARLRPNGQYGLHASLSGPDGELWFVSDTRVPVDPERNLPVEILMVRVPGPGEATAANATHWQCGDTRVSATFDPKSESATLSVNGRRLTLPLVRSASGARYADEQGNEFWTKGESGTLALVGEEKSQCTPAEGPSPWDAARARNIAFRAVGNEPGWLVEVGHGETPPLHAQLDFGARNIDIAQTQPIKDGLGFTGQTANGTQVELHIENTRCQDPMSGAVFEASARLSAGGKTYHGCGAFLDR
ncbi:YbaY family lipoprotein [Lysobacter sp. LF1]|uniref:YbaY family lipoprotein n=1 Tax=Lysobacter stagni TaxID=3045172 RepID=A0ABT6XIZ2_9GAMM|nr:YbaY family lipoprotein [Lysobacter sp. LF1]MDI9240133.1 YbaY family lipoprotein [Lysobacter sp. LF1]